MAELPPPPKGMVLTHFIVSDDVERSRRFYTEVLGGRVVFGPVPINVELANSFLIELGQTTDPEGDWLPAGWSSSTPVEESE
jgi:catechol 2,3-dioxygenase-like lactoylglutathione lyase family enzyme